MKTDLLFPSLRNYAESILEETQRVPEERRQQLLPVLDYLLSAISKQQEPQLLFVCTQNSRRSIFCEVWAQWAAWNFGIKNFHAFSAGSGSTTLNLNTRDALIRAGIRITALTGGVNPLYKAELSESFPSLFLFSKGIDFLELPGKNFGAVLVCVDDAETCPFIPNADVRIPLPYSDPKKFDGKDEMQVSYDNCCRQIAAEMFWLMKTVSKKING